MAFESDFSMILFFGCHGQLARSFQATQPSELEDQTVFASSQEANFEQPKILPGFLDHFGPRIVVVCSAYTQVDKAEVDRELALKINSQAPQEIARWCGQNDAFMIHFSTDYVFSGIGSRPWKESDPTGPKNWYGETKLSGELSIQNTSCRHLIFRTSWVFSEYGKNFVKTMLRLGSERYELSIVQDQFGSPTYAPDIATAVWPIVAKINHGEKLKSGTYHLAGSGEASWAEFAEFVFEEGRRQKFDLKVSEIHRIKSEQFPTAAERPLNSRLDQNLIKTTFGIEMPHWHDSVRLCLKRIGTLK